MATDNLSEMCLTDLASELLLQIYRNCTSISDVVNLSLTCRRMHTLLPSTQRLSILFSAAEAEFGPLHDAIQLVTYTRNSTNLYHTHSFARLSLLGE